MKTYNSNLDKHHFIHFHRFQCNEPTTLALENFNFIEIRLLQDSNADHIPAGPEIALFSNADYCVPELLITQGFQQKFERLKMCSNNTFQVSDILK